MTITLAVTGSRELEDAEFVWAQISRMQPEVVIVGDCSTGVDALTRQWCRVFGVRCEVLTADWAKFGKSAGPRRNRRLVRKAKEEGAFLLAFPRGGPGTRDCIAQAKRVGLHVREV